MGHSRYERPVWSDWLLAAFLSTIGVLAGHAVATLLDPARPYLGSAQDAFDWLVLAVPGVLCGIVVSGLCVWFGHRAGWRRAWVVAAAVGAIAGIGVTIVGWNWL